MGGRVARQIPVAVVALLAAAQVAGAAPTSAVPPSVTDNLRELNNKLARTISAWQDRSVGPGERFRRTLKDLETTKLRAVDGFPETFGVPYSKTFVELSCVDEKLALADEISRLDDLNAAAVDAGGRSVDAETRSPRPERQQKPVLSRN